MQEIASHFPNRKKNIMIVLQLYSTNTILHFTFQCLIIESSYM